MELNQSIPQDDEVEQLDESLLGLLRTGEIAVNARNSIQLGRYNNTQENCEVLVINYYTERPRGRTKRGCRGFRTLDLFLDMEEMMTVLFDCIWFSVF